MDGLYIHRHVKKSLEGHTVPPGVLAWSYKGWRECLRAELMSYFIENTGVKVEAMWLSKGMSPLQEVGGVGVKAWHLCPQCNVF